METTLTREEVNSKSTEFLNSIPDFSKRGEILKYSKIAAEYDMFYIARGLLLMLINNEKYKYEPTEKDHQNLAKYIYKDPNLTSDYKFEKALQHLPKYQNIELVTDCETAGLIGAIFKRKWYYDKEIINLETSEKFYEKGKDIWEATLENQKLNDEKKEYDAKEDEKNQHAAQTNDYGYCANNLAFVKELLAKEKYDYLNSINAVKKSDFKKLISDAKDIRKKIVDTLANENRDDLNQNILDSHKINNKTENLFDLRFHYATLIEALIGLAFYEKANKIITIYNQLFSTNTNWKKRSAIEQLHLLSDLQLYITTHIEPISNFSEKDFEGSLKIIYNKPLDLPIPATQCKSGLALSGGGFRASYFHIGVLAALAENDKLKDVEVISCVSGGSILGAFYYLKLRNLLNSKTESQLTPEDYQCLVKKMISEFHCGVQENLRARWFSNFKANVKIVVFQNYSRTNRMAELYDIFFYKNITNENKIALRNTIISPIGDTKFNIHNDNYARVYKVPQLILNTTALNTGHNFQFASTWMGEPPILINTDINVKSRLKRVYYNNLTNTTYKNYPLCNAVGASACVPALFIALVLNDLFKDMKLKLVDGGVYDNQGTTAIIENECKNCIISDASGQLLLENSSAVNPFTELFRSSLVSAEHIRELQLNQMIKETKNRFYDSLHLLHLKKDLQEKPLSAMDTSSSGGISLTTYSNSIATTYNVDKNLQKAISNIRTDLDSFTDAEAYSLMYSGYLQTIASLTAKDRTTKSDMPWEFKIMEKEFSEAKKLTKELEIGSKMFFKGWYILKLKHPIVTFGFLIAIITAIVITTVVSLFNNNLSTAVCDFFNNPFTMSFKDWCDFSLSSPWKITILFLFILELAGKPLFNKFGIKTTPIKMTINLLLLTLAMLISWIYLYTFNKLYNWLGSR